MLFCLNIVDFIWTRRTLILHLELIEVNSFDGRRGTNILSMIPIDKLEEVVLVPLSLCALGLEVGGF